MSTQDKAVRVLPYWLSNPCCIGHDLVKDGCSLDAMPWLDSALCAKLKQNGIERFFPVQKALIPEIWAQEAENTSWVRPNDICVSAMTGSGKTLAYVLPILHCMKPFASLATKIRALVVLPTVPLALQSLKVFREYSKCVGLKVGTAIGLSSLQQEQSELVRRLQLWEQQLVDSGCCGVTGVPRSASDRPTHCMMVDILVATPDRLKDHVALTPAFDLSQLRYVVFDEADRLMSGDGGHWLNSIVQIIEEQQKGSNRRFSSVFSCPDPRAMKLLFSATLSCNAETLQVIKLHNPVLYSTIQSDPNTRHKKQTGAKESEKIATAAVNITNYTVPSSLTEQYVVCELNLRPLLLHHLVVTRSWKRILVFTNSIEASHNLAITLQHMAAGHYRVAEFSSSIGKFQAEMVRKFQRGDIQVLVSTDSLARGMDFTEVNVVVNYDRTLSHTTYLHRVGRTARAGKPGLALSIIRSSQVSDFSHMVKQHCSNKLKEVHVDIKKLHPYESMYKEALALLKTSVSQEKRRSVKRLKKQIVGKSEPS
ncbi:DEAD/DEAH box helicase domain [Trinorchestia longiramus]|nr:DEAD/DEAH box helicase domain [Trinorchestia longiramus]